MVKEMLSAKDNISIIKMKKGGKRANYLLCVLVVATFLFCINYLLFDTLYIKCIVKELTGYDCPACGAQRAMVSLLKGTLIDAFWYNPYLLLVSITLSLAIIKRKILNNKQVRLIYIILVLLMVVWVIVRNLPIWKEYVITKLSL